MNILMAASELAPFAGTGKFADDMLALAGELRKAGHEVSVVLPYYRAIRENKEIKTKRTGVKFSVPVGTGRFPCEIYEAAAPNGIQVFMVARDEYFDRSGFYGVDGRDYQDNAARFIFFSKCALELARRIQPEPHIVHAHGWQTGLIPAFVRDQRLPFQTVFTPHTLAYQGNFWSYDFGLTNLPEEYFSARGVEFYGSMNCLKSGILYADSVVLPSERFVAEAQMPNHGCGLETVLQEHSYKLSGIFDGVDYSSWNPANDPNLADKLSKSSNDRKKNRAALLKNAGLKNGTPQTILLAHAESSARAGVDLLLASLDRLPAENLRVLLLGDVDPAQEKALGIATRKYAGVFAHRPEYDDAFLHQALGGADIFVVPGPLEPTGEMLVRALRYGLLPLAMACGGLHQLVQDYDPVTGSGNGLVFHVPTVGALVDSIRRAVNIRQSAETWKLLTDRGMEADFSWTAAAKRHETLYSGLLKKAGMPLAA